MFCNVPVKKVFKYRVWIVLTKILKERVRTIFFKQYTPMKAQGEAYFLPPARNKSAILFFFAQPSLDEKPCIDYY